MLLCLLAFALINQLSSQVFKPVKEVDSIPKDKAVVYIYTHNNRLAGLNYVYVNDHPVSYLPIDTDGCLIYYADPGTNVFHTNLWRGGDLVVQIYPGESVFIRGFYLTGETAFRRIPPDLARKDLKRCKVYEQQCIIDSEKIRSIALISTTISKAELPTFPVLDASGFNEKVYSILDKIVAMQKLNLYRSRETVAYEIAKYFKGKVLFGDSLNLKHEVQLLQNKYNTISPIIINEKSYPTLITLNDDIKPFPDYKDDIKRFFREPENYKKVITEIGQALKTDLIVVCNMNYSLTTNSLIMEGGRINLNTYLYLFSPDGNLLTKGSKGYESSGSISGNSIRDFENALNILPFTLAPILEDITCDLTEKMNKK